MSSGDRPSYEDRRRSFGMVAEQYHRYRPGYPLAAIDWVVGPTADRPIRVLDLAAGTGRLTVGLLAAGHEVVAVEPDPAMLSVLRRELPVEAHAGSAEAIPLADAEVDVVAIGQAFHWFEVPRALPEIHRVLRPEGTLGVLGNLLDDRVDWVDAMCAVTGGEARRSVARAQPDPELSPWFGEVEGREFDNVQVMDLTHLVGLVESWSFVYLHERRAEILRRVEETVRDHLPSDQLDRIELPYVTAALRARRLG